MDSDNLATVPCETLKECIDKTIFSIAAEGDSQFNLTAALMDRMLDWFGFHDFLPAPFSPDGRKHRLLKTDYEPVYRVADYLREHEYTGIGPIADHLGLSDYEASRHLQEAIKTAAVMPEKVGLLPVQRWLDNTLPGCVDERWVQGGRRLKPLMTRLRKKVDCPDGLDYIQLQAALRRLYLV